MPAQPLTGFLLGLAGLHKFRTHLHETMNDIGDDIEAERNADMGQTGGQQQTVIEQGIKPCGIHIDRRQAGQILVRGIERSGKTRR